MATDTAPAETQHVALLAELATEYGVATRYEDWAGRRVDVAPDTVRAVLALFDVDTTDPVAALAAARERPWRRLLPATVVAKQPAPGAVLARVSAHCDPRLTIDVAPGHRIELIPEPAPPGGYDSYLLHGAERLAVPFRLPADLPLGDHLLRVDAGDETGTALLVVVPDRIALPPALTGRAWGWMAQLYSLRSAGSWGMGDYADLRTFAAWSGSPDGGGAGVLLVNPLHAVPPTVPVQPSPYYPASRRFASPLYLRPEALPEYAAADDATRARVDALRRSVPAASEVIDRDAVWTAKRAALELLFPFSRRPDAVGDVVGFSVWSRLAEQYGPSWRDWPDGLRDPGSLADGADVGSAPFHRWLQQCCDAQLADAQRAATDAGMSVGIVHDLAVGVDPGGADAWAAQDVFAIGATVGAPPDSFNQQGQNWRLPPWRPDRLAETGYAPFREMVRATLRRGGGIRVDHVMGLFRLWWVPAGSSAAHGTYVRYDAEALLGLLALEATRTGALVVGEDLGTVEPAVVETLADWGVLGSSVLWFEREDDGETPLPPERWRELTMASVTTHDLPTAAGFLAAEHVHVRAELGQLGRPVAEEAAAAAAERAALLGLLRAEGLLPAGDVDPVETVVAMHELLARTPSRVVLAALGDAVGELRQPNLPGTTDQYPNWRLPLADGTGRQVTLEEFVASPAVHRLARVLADGLAGTPAPAPVVPPVG